MSRFEEYAKKYPDIRMERRDGILQITFQTDGGSLKWSERAHRDLPCAFADIGGDVENKIVIMTGDGEEFLTVSHFTNNSRRTPYDWDSLYWDGKKLLIVDRQR